MPKSSVEGSDPTPTTLPTPLPSGSTEPAKQRGKHERADGKLYIQTAVRAPLYEEITALATAMECGRSSIVEAILEFCEMQLGEIVAVKVQHQHKNQSYAVEVHDYEDAGRNLCFVATCSACGSRDYVGKSHDMRLPSTVIAAKFTEKGWSLGPTAKKNRCPRCRHPNATLMGTTIVGEGFEVPLITTEIPSEPPATKETETMAVLPSQKPRQLTGAETRQVSALLEEHFDEKNGKYDEKWDDQVIADKVNVPRASVANLRIEGWGQIRAFPDVEALKSEAIELRSMLNDFDHRIREAERRRLGA